MDPDALARLALGTIIALCRQRIRDLTQHQLEERADLSTGSVSRFERGDGLPSPAALDRIGHALDVPPVELRWAASSLLDHLQRLFPPAEPADTPNPLADPLPGLAPGSPAPMHHLPPNLALRWQRLQADESTLRRLRDQLTLDTTAHLLLSRPSG